MTASSRRPQRAAWTAGAASAALCLGALTVPTATAQPAAAPDAPRLDAAIAAIPAAGAPGAYGAAQDGDGRWTGAAGVADLTEETPADADSWHRIASVTKTFVSVAVLQQVAEGTVDLDAPAADHLPAGTLPDALAEEVTVRMLLNHTSGIGDYVQVAFPSLRQLSPESLEEHRYRELAPEELVEMGLSARSTGEPGERYSYSNTNYILAGMLLGEVTGVSAEEYVTEHVIERAGLSETFFPDSPELPTPHARLYDPLHGTQDPPGDYTEYDMSWAGTAGALVSTMTDLNEFQRALFSGELLPEKQLSEMLDTVPMTNGNGEQVGAYGLGLYEINLSCGKFWGHDGVAWGASTLAFSSEDGERQAAIGYNVTHYQTLAEDGTLNHHPVDTAVARYLDEALCGSGAQLSDEKLGQVQLTLENAGLSRSLG
ncbi:D-alanyl-D-alanine carboxypeptidase [Streptomyces zhaozhouensis]|uniref:D-alanyl-D-alanine carboxypeptidase n=1 Tax=Streptomyces zhaozhouensis TaxID=1300267 RepID=A0A286DXC8_9ACTN|nr:serine hydrolase domain-containing protein [Streptomyces zhaozhouensis]SOD63293.1 D-alanyl-D-alanine carboxypeptidase [Streptomyces zhaozhouensis]